MASGSVIGLIYEVLYSKDLLQLSFDVSLKDLPEVRSKGIVYAFSCEIVGQVVKDTNTDSIEQEFHYRNHNLIRAYSNYWVCREWMCFDTNDFFIDQQKDRQSLF